MIEAKRPKDMTPEELAALPVGPMVEERRPADPSKGEVGRFVVKLVMRQQAATHYRGDDLLACVVDGATYSLGQFADGTWFRRPL